MDPPTPANVSLAGKALLRFRSGGVPAVCGALVEHARGRYEAWVDVSLDRRYGLQTGGLQDDLAKLGISGRHVADANGYEAIGIPKFRAMVRATGVDPRRYLFVDLGCGKARALILAAEYGFRRVLGVELSPPLHRLACRNVEAFRRLRPESPPIVVHCGDAATYPLPAGDTVLFLNNPFKEPIVRSVAANIGSLRTGHGRVVVAYGNPVHHEAFAGVAGLREKFRNRSFAIYG